MNIGILYPRSKAHPSLLPDFMDGIKASLKQELSEGTMQLFSESIGFGAAEKEVYEKAEKLLVLENADILIAYVDMRVAPILAPLMHASGKLLILVNAGANYPDNWIPQPGTIYLTLQHAFASWLTGSLAGKMKNKNGVFATTFFDCGYLHSAAMIKEFTVAEGNIVFNYINKQAYDNQFEIKQLTDFLAANKNAENLLCAFDSLPASLFYKLLSESEQASSLHLFATPMMLEPDALKGIGEGFPFSIDGHVPWIASQNNDGNKIFKEVYKDKTKRDPSIFALQGWETGLVLKQIFIDCKTYYIDGNKITDHLATIQIDGPRGEMKFNKETHYFFTPVHKCSLKNNTANLESEWINNIDDKWKAFTAIENSSNSAGWLNTYLCY
ncbi:MAG TPA: ABC transporter substrate-binding protein [Ferruginibacter sp.]|jgi:branched-chain amino acid transport system substrate-binding protein|nr:ABC transporter substrate-binding protein [Ferruginibacter sp.]